MYAFSLAAALAPLHHGVGMLGLGAALAPLHHGAGMVPPHSRSHGRIASVFLRGACALLHHRVACPALPGSEVGHPRRGEHNPLGRQSILSVSLVVDRFAADPDVPEARGRCPKLLPGPSPFHHFSTPDPQPASHEDVLVRKLGCTRPGRQGGRGRVKLPPQKSA